MKKTVEEVVGILAKMDVKEVVGIWNSYIDRIGIGEDYGILENEPERIAEVLTGVLNFKDIMKYCRNSPEKYVGLIKTGYSFDDPWVVVDYYNKKFVSFTDGEVISEIDLREVAKEIVTSIAEKKSGWLSGSRKLFV